MDTLQTELEAETAVRDCAPWVPFRPSCASEFRSDCAVHGTATGVFTHRPAGREPSRRGNHRVIVCKVQAMNRMVGWRLNRSPLPPKIRTINKLTVALKDKVKHNL